MSKVYSRFDLPKKKPTEPGDRMRDTYKWSKNNKGEEYLAHDTIIDRQAEIESYADECDIKNIVARASFDPMFAQSLAQGAMSGEYTDTTEYPETIHELKRMADEAGKTVEEIKEKLNKPEEKPEEKPEKKSEAKTNEPE